MQAKWKWNNLKRTLQQHVATWLQIKLHQVMSKHAPPKLDAFHLFNLNSNFAFLIFCFSVILLQNIFLFLLFLQKKLKVVVTVWWIDFNTQYKNRHFCMPILQFFWSGLKRSHYYYITASCGKKTLWKNRLYFCNVIAIKKCDRKIE